MLSQLFEEDGDYFFAIYDLLTQALDPCNMLRVVESEKALSVTPESVITNQVIIWHNGEDITSQLSLMITDGDNLQTLSALISDVVDLLSTYSDHTQSGDMMQLIQRVLYVSGLVSISTSIPTETFNVSLGNLELFTVRVDGVSVVNVTVRGIDIALQTEQDDVDVR